jgi:hypothetical protein
VQQTKTVSMKGFTPTDCSRFCSGLASKEHRISLDFNKVAAIGTIQITLDHQISTDFTKDWNLVRDQGVGGSNPLSPTNLFNILHVLCATQEIAL